jgi:hypothetical protein
MKRLRTDLVGLVVELRVVLVDISSFWVFERSSDSIRSKRLPPFFIRCPHLLGSGDIELPRTKESEKGGIVESVVPGDIKA